MEGDSVQTGVLAVACPKCGGKLRHKSDQVHCENCDFALWTVMASRRFKASELEQLIADGSVGPLQGFRSKTGEAFTATIILTPALSVEFHFGPGQHALTTP